MHRCRRYRIGRSCVFVGIVPSAGDNMRYRLLLSIAGNGKLYTCAIKKGGEAASSVSRRFTDTKPPYLARVCVSARFSDLSRRATLAQDLPKLSPSFGLGAAALVPSS